MRVQLHARLPRLPRGGLLTQSVSLELSCSPECHTFGLPLFEQLAGGNYDVCSVLPVPESLEAWRAAQKTARKRAARSERLGYRFSEIERHEYADDIYDINTSLPERQGRRMSEGYWQRPSDSPLPDYPCVRHSIRTFGVLDIRGVLVAYLSLYRCGELALVSQILGHGDRRKDDVMFLLFAGAVGSQAGYGGFFVYNRWDSGTGGLRDFKRRLGFSAMEVEWKP